MKAKILLLVVLLSLTAFSQIMEGPYFNELKGMEDKNGKTHLFYRMHYLRTDNDRIYRSLDEIWELCPDTKSDNKFLDDYGKMDRGFIEFIKVNNVKFWNSDPSKYIFCGSLGWVASRGYIQQFDSLYYLTKWAPVENIFLSGKNDSLLLASSAPWLISNNGGRDWDTLLSYRIKDTLIGIHPQKDSVIFFIRDNHLWKSHDLGFHSKIVDSSIKMINYEPVFDSDSKHVYFIGIDNRGRYSLFVSDNEGEPGSLRQCFESYNNILISVDKSKPGNIYVTDGFQVFFSDSYGLYFKQPKNFNKKIIGIYKKPNSNKLFLSQRYQLLEMENDSVTIIKRLPIPSHLLNLYPLAIGNKWIYDAYSQFLGTKTPCSIIHEVVGDTLMNNGKKYFIVKYIEKEILSDTSYSFERVDSSSGKIYRYYIYKPPATEIVAEDVTSEDGEFAFVNNFMTSDYSTGSKCKANQTTLFGTLHTSLSFSYFINGIGGLNYSLVSDIGISEFYKTMELGLLQNAKLKGAIINSKIYGDTTITDVKYPLSNMPQNYFLFQNYPNPFNPSTIIKYSLPHESKVVLTIYNTLGQKVKELVNEVKSPGFHQITFDGSSLSSGIYFYRLQAGGYSDTKKLIIEK